MPNVNSHTEKYVIYLSAVFTVAGFAVLWYFMFFPEKPLRLNRPIQVESAKWDASDHLTRIVFTMDYCKLSSYSEELAEVHFSLKDGLSYDLPGVYVEYEPTGCHVVREVLIVPELASKTYQLEMYRFYQTPLSRDVLVRSISPVFEVK
jgi:hypothetical protein